MNNLTIYNNYMMSIEVISALVIGILLLLAILVIYVRKSNQTKIRTELKTSNKYPFKVEELLTALGSLDNIVDAIGSHSKVKFTLLDTKKIDVENLKKLSTGMIQSSTAVTLIFGNISKPLAIDIESMMN